MRYKTRRRILIYLGYIISIVLVYLAFRKVEFAALWNSISEANYWWVAVNIVLVVAMMWYRAYRWKFMVDPVKKIPMNKLFSSTMIGFMASNVLPLRLGEFVRAWSLGRIADVSRSAVLATVVIERIFDSFALLTFLTAILLFKRLPLPAELQDFGYLFLLANVTALAVLILLRTKPEPTLKVIKSALAFLPSRISGKLMEMFIKFTEGLEVMGDVRVILKISFQSIILWTVTGLSNYFIFLAFGLGHLPIDASFVVLVIVSIGIMIPQSPGFVGGYHLCVWYALKPYGVQQDTAMAVAVVLHGAQYIVITLVGFYYLRREHLSLREAEEASITEKEVAQE
ncbi:MAG: flippase-like domain-containing protein [candidate division Zixibacteria bacterium]|nr:flippase-like domain-containing protein [candidate division Zixibacteria bacterium]MBU1470572.1 flippase-like domain-containing protein [candidate division Zixibacteria bacterium]MBU2624454.1 flippase-like domain-containing protein [candidate division Zixibacteria bacterium]